MLTRMSNLGTCVLTDRPLPCTIFIPMLLRTVCFSHLSTDPIEIVQDSINFEMFYPTVGDNTQLVSNLVARMFVQRIPGLQSLSAEATPHIKHLYSKQMALKSEVVCSYLLLHNIPNLLLLMHSAIGSDAKK